LPAKISNAEAAAKSMQKTREQRLALQQIYCNFVTWIKLSNHTSRYDFSKISALRNSLTFLSGAQMTEPRKDSRSASTRQSFDYKAFMAMYSGVTQKKFGAGEIIYAQGDPAEAVFYIISGSIKIAVLSEHGKEGVIAMLGPGDFFGEGCLDGRAHRTSTISATTASEVVRISREAVRRALAEDAAFSELFFRWILHRNEKLKSDLMDQLFNSSEKRLARILLTLANIGPSDTSGVITIPMTQETLASMVGTTRARINQFMTKFRKLGHVEYNGSIRVHNSLHDVIFKDGSGE
jgi:CRP/FNR family cyclic AMP-dependent transcriptional regulator